MKNNISSFLHSGFYYDYFPEESLFKNYTDKETILSKGDLQDYLCCLVESLASESMSDVIVPLSGGLDSRLILASLLQVFDANKIHTFTFGVPGSLDFEIANIVAGKCGTKHTKINLDDMSFDLESLLYNSRISDDQTICFYSTPFYELKRIYGDNASFWSGFMGDPVAGSKFKVGSSNDGITGFKEQFIRENSLGTSFSLLRDTKDLNCGGDKSNFFSSGFSDCEQFNFFNRQMKYIRPHVAPNERYITPFVDENWARYWSNIPIQEKINTLGYEQFCTNSFEKLFSLPSKNNFGMGSTQFDKILSTFLRVGNRIFSSKPLKSRLSYVDRRQNYFDMDLKINSNTSFSQLIKYLEEVALKEMKICNEGLYRKLNTEFDRSNPYNRIVLSSLGIHILNGKSIEGAY